MIIAGTWVVKILLAMLAGVFIWKSRVKYSKQMRCVLGVILLGAICIAQAVTSLVPPLTDEITLTALGEKNESAKAAEVYVSGFTVDDKKVEVQPAVEGKWFWAGNNYYAWRIETDTRQPKGTTRSVTLEVPVGWNRTIDFVSNEWKGKVEIAVGDNRWIADTYVGEGGIHSEQIGQSAISQLIWSQICYLIVYAVVFGAIFYVGMMATVNIKSLRKFSEKHEGVFIFALIALFQLFIAIKYSGIDCFWYDELYEIGWSAEASNLLERAFIGNAPLPIYEIIFHLWYLIAPYGERWLLLLGEICTAVGIFYIGMAGKELKSVWTGIIASLGAAVSSIIIVQCSYEIRSYPLYFMMAAILLYLYLQSYRNTEKKGYKEIAKITIAMVLFAGMHYHAVIFCIALFALDVIAYFCFQIKNRSIVPYLVAAASYIPNIICVWKTKFMTNFSAESWQPIPSLREINALLSYWAGNSTFLLLCFLLGITVVICTIMYKNQKRRNEIKCVIPIFLMTFVVLFFVVYGNLINPKATLWSNRYFIDLLPCFLLVCGYGVDGLCDVIGKNFIDVDNKKASTVIILFVSLVLIKFSLPGMINAAETVRQPYRMAADWLYGQSNYIYNDTTLILSSNPQTVVTGWNEYYLTKQGRRDVVNVTSEYSISPEELLQYERIYVVNLHENLHQQKIKDILNNNYLKVEENNGCKIVVYQKNRSL